MLILEKKILLLLLPGLKLAGEVRVRQALCRPPFLGPSPCGASSAVPKEGCLVTRSAAECCPCVSYIHAITYNQARC